MFKPRLRIPRGIDAARLSPSSAAATTPRQMPSPFAVPARQQQQQQQRCIHASPVRRLHEVPQLTDDARFERVGVPGLFSPESFQMAYNTYQSWVLHRLNEMVAGTQYENLTTLQTLLLTSREPHLAATFNYASMAHNNHFFFDGLSKTGGEDKNEHMSEALKEALERSFGSLETMRREFILTADSMFGPGFLWLVMQTDAPGAQARPFRILPTYLAGTPYPQAHWRSQGVDMNNHGGNGDVDVDGGAVIKEYFDKSYIANAKQPLHVSPLSGKAAEAPPGGTNIVPVLCVNTWEHVWMWDYSIGGKVDFVANWWKIINWGKVHELAKIGTGPQMSMSPSWATTAAAASPAPAAAVDSPEWTPGQEAGRTAEANPVDNRESGY